MERIREFEYTGNWNFTRTRNGPERKFWKKKKNLTAIKSFESHRFFWVSRLTANKHYFNLGLKGMTFSGSGLIGVMVSLKGEYCSLDCCIKILFQNVFEFNMISIRYKSCILQKLILIYFWWYFNFYLRKKLYVL